MAPARLNMEETAWLLGFAAHDIPILVQAGLLKPFGHPPRQGTKYFAAATIEKLRVDLKWMGRASDAIVQHWRKKNGENDPGAATGRYITRGESSIPADC